MGKLEVYDGKQTKWEGLWWHPEYNGFSSASINLAALKAFKGTVRLYMRKNKYYNDGENGRPNYVFCIKDSNSDVFRNVDVIADTTVKRDDGNWYTRSGERLYTYDEVQHAINCAVCDVGGDRCYGEYLVSDYL